MKEKENEITDLADCTNHAYHVLWLARRIQHLWITAAIIVRECTGSRMERGRGGWRRGCGLAFAALEYPSESERARVGRQVGS